MFRVAETTIIVVHQVFFSHSEKIFVRFSHKISIKTSKIRLNLKFEGQKAKKPINGKYLVFIDLKFTWWYRNFEMEAEYILRDFGWAREDLKYYN